MHLENGRNVLKKQHMVLSPPKDGAPQVPAFPSVLYFSSECILTSANTVLGGVKNKNLRFTPEPLMSSLGLRHSHSFSPASHMWVKKQAQKQAPACPGTSDTLGFFNEWQ